MNYVICDANEGGIEYMPLVAGKSVTYLSFVVGIVHSMIEDHTASSFSASLGP